MYCCHCGKKINEKKLEKKKLSLSISQGEIDEGTKVEYVCPRCSHLIHKDVSEQEIKSLAAASHAEIQRGHNNFASGMSFNLIGLIILILGIIFFLLAHKPANNFELVTSCPEYYVCLVCFAISAVLIIIGIVFTTNGIIRRIKYSRLLKTIQDETFYQ